MCVRVRVCVCVCVRVRGKGGVMWGSRVSLRDSTK